MLAGAILAVLFLLAARVPWEQGEQMQGVAHVVDGDTLVIAATRIRLAGIDAPEIGQSCVRDGGPYACGEAARATLARLAGTSQLICQGRGHDRYQRVVARCSAGEVELNRRMVELGWAVAYGDYHREERAARQAGNGLWAGSFEQPQQWRRMRGEGEADETPGLLARFFKFWPEWLFGKIEEGSSDEAI